VYLLKCPSACSSGTTCIRWSARFSCRELVPATITSHTYIHHNIPFALGAMKIWRFFRALLQAASILGASAGVALGQDLSRLRIGDSSDVQHEHHPAPSTPLSTFSSQHSSGTRRLQIGLALSLCGHFGDEQRCGVTLVAHELLVFVEMIRCLSCCTYARMMRLASDVYASHEEGVHISQ